MHYRSTIQPKRGNHSQEPRWIALNKATRSRLPRKQIGEIVDQGSLTQRLIRASTGDFRVEVVYQGWQRPLFSERRVLGLQDREISLVREVKLICKGETWVIARSIIPRKTLVGSTKRLAYLGNKPLGATLFKDPSLKRVLVEISAIQQTQLPDFSLDANETLSFWGRRSIFQISGRELLVGEIFLPACPAL